MTKLQHCCTGSGARLMDSKRMRKGNKSIRKDIVKIIWNFSIQIETNIDHNKPQLILLEKEKMCYIVAVASPFDPRIETKEKDKVKNYTALNIRS